MDTPTQADQNTVSQDKAPTTTIRCSNDVYEALRVAAFNRRVTQVEIVDAAVRQYLKLTVA